MQMSRAEMIYAAVAGALIGLGYHAFTSSGEPGGLAAVPLPAWGAAAAIGAAAALIAFAVRRWVDSAK